MINKVNGRFISTKNNYFKPDIMSKYTKKELNEWLHKEVEIVLAEENDEDTFSFKGKIVSFNMDVEDGDFCFYTDHGAIKKFNFSNLKNIRVL